MTNQASIKYISSLLDRPSNISDGDHNSIALFRQSFPYFVPARYILAAEKHRKATFSPAMISEIQPYMGNWLLLCSFLEASKADAVPATGALGQQTADNLVTSKRNVDINRPSNGHAEIAEDKPGRKMPEFTESAISGDHKPAQAQPTVKDAKTESAGAASEEAKAKVVTVKASEISGEKRKEPAKKVVTEVWAPPTPPVAPGYISADQKNEATKPSVGQGPGTPPPAAVVPAIKAEPKPEPPVIAEIKVPVTHVPPAEATKQEEKREPVMPVALEAKVPVTPAAAVGGKPLITESRPESPIPVSADVKAPAGEKLEINEKERAIRPDVTGGKIPMAPMTPVATDARAEQKLQPANASVAPNISGVLPVAIVVPRVDREQNQESPKPSVAAAKIPSIPIVPVVTEINIDMATDHVKPLAPNVKVPEPVVTQVERKNTSEANSVLAQPAAPAVVTPASPVASEVAAINGTQKATTANPVIVEVKVARVPISPVIPETKAEQKTEPMKPVISEVNVPQNPVTPARPGSQMEQQPKPVVPADPDVRFLVPPIAPMSPGRYEEEQVASTKTEDPKAVPVNILPAKVNIEEDGTDKKIVYAQPKKENTATIIPVKVTLEEVNDDEKEIVPPREKQKEPHPVTVLAGDTEKEKMSMPEDNVERDGLIRPVYTEDYFLQQGVKVSLDIPEKIKDFKEAPEVEDKSLMVMMSFSEWLLHFKNNTEKLKEEKKDQKALKTMWQKEKLAAAMEEENEEIPENVFEMAVNSITKEDGLASESLADIYIKQGKYDKAIEMYRKLSLRNPKKNAYFARRIEEVLKEKQS